VLLASLAGLLLLLTGAVGPAQAAETQWIDFGGNARALSAVYSVSVGGLDYQVTRGTDGNVWFRYAAGTWRPLGGFSTARTPSPPRIVEFPRGRAMALIRGTDNEIWYSQALSGATNSWTSWTRFPAGSNAIGSPLVTVQPAGSSIFLDVPNAHRRISTMVMWNFGGVLTPSSRWHVDDHALLGTNHTDIEGDSQIAIYGTEYHRSVLRDFYTGADHRVYRETINPSNNTFLSVEAVNGSAECATGVGAAHLGAQTTVAAPGQPGFSEQQRVLISCVGTDGYVWESTSSNGGRTFDGWRHPSGYSAPSRSTPAVFPTPSENRSWTIDIRWNGRGGTVFPDNSIVAKKVT